MSLIDVTTSNHSNQTGSATPPEWIRFRPAPMDASGGGFVDFVGRRIALDLDVMRAQRVDGEHGGDSSSSSGPSWGSSARSSG
jgi:hypothetical protein